MKVKHIIISFFLFALILNPVFAQKTDIKVDGQQIKDYITYMADDEYLGRKPLTPEFWELHEWAKNLFEDWGLEPGGENGTFFQSVPITGYRGTYAFSRGTPEMVIDKREFFTKFNDFSVDHRSVTDKKMKGEIVFVGFGISAPEKNLDEYAGVDVKDKFVLVFKGSPADVETPRGYFSPESGEENEVDWEIESQDSTKIEVAYQKGAAGILIYEKEEEDNFRYRREPVEKSTFKRDFMIVSEISERVFHWIMWKDDQESMRGFNTRMNQIQLKIKEGKAQSFATGKKAEIRGFESTEYYGEKFSNHHCRNVIGKITGTDPDLKNEFIVLGGHFDHVGVRNGQVYNGADDNASGSAVVMEMARLMKKHNVPTKRTVYFCLWTGEELGLIGSRYWVDNPTDGVTMDRVVANFNMDMVGLGETINAGGGLNFPSMWDIIAKYQDPEIMEIIKPRTGGPGGSDHSGFIELGIEAVFLITGGGGGHPDYHDTGDDAEKIDPEILRKTGQFLLQATKNLGNAPESLIIQGRQELYDGLRWNITAINPELDVRGGWSVIDAATPSDMAKLIMDKVNELKDPEQTRPHRRYYRRRPRLNLDEGVAGARLFNFDLNYLNVAHKVLGFGRLDVTGDDGKWFDRGLTECGAKALKSMQDSSIVLNLVNPSVETFNSVLEAAEKPFIVSGMTEFDSTQIALINEKEVLVTVPLAPENMDAFCADLKNLTNVFGDKDNIIIKLVSDENLDEMKQKLYMKLIKNGWTKKEIYAIGGAGTERGSVGNFTRFMPPRRSWRR